ncbi:MAG TPA: DcaP family trimeric outer membrane transporter [Gemmatimonadaceae bacterium]|nr:DcaP family trimeric outer membrane transporter [Gemmatimonadaceae bacterium]
MGWRRLNAFLAVLIVATTLRAQSALAQSDTTKKPWLTVYGFAQLDLIGDFNVVDPAWFDVVRPSKLPSFDEEFGKNGHTYVSVRQTRFGIRAGVPTGLGELTTRFEFDLFGTGVDAGQTTFRLRYAYGQLGQFAAGQMESPFMDINVFPNTVEYWGPNGMVFFRNPQVRWMPMQGTKSLTIALERPGASADAGDFADRIQLQDVVPRFPLPDLSAAYRQEWGWGYLRGAVILRRMDWDQLHPDTIDLSGSATGWGINLSSNVKVTKNDVLRLEATFGKGVENYMNDAPADVGAQPQPENTRTPFTGVPLGLFGMVAYLDHTWNDRFTSSVGYSRIDIDNSDGQSSDAFKNGQYASANVLYTPVKDMLVGAELIWGHRTNKSDGFSSSDTRIQFTFKYNFSATIGKGAQQ